MTSEQGNKPNKKPSFDDDLLTPENKAEAQRGFDYFCELEELESVPAITATEWRDRRADKELLKEKYFPSALEPEKQAGTKPQDAQTLPADTEPAPVMPVPTIEPRLAATGPTFTMTKDAMVKQYKNEWPTVARDIADAKRSGLSAAAKAGARGWNEAKAKEWARCNGKLTSTEKPGSAHAGASSIFDSPTSRKHTLEG